MVTRLNRKILSTGSIPSMTFLGEASASFRREFRHHSALPPCHQQIHNYVIDEHRLKQNEPVCELNSFSCCQIVQRNNSCYVSMHSRKEKNEYAAIQQVPLNLHPSWSSASSSGKCKPRKSGQNDYI